MYEWADEFFETNDYVQYEISNWARRVESRKTKINSALQPSTSDLRPEFACRHNLQYWRGLPYLAFGAGAHGYANGYRYSNVLRIKTYIERLSDPSSFGLHTFPLSPATVNQHRQTESDDMGEFMMMGLRLTREGVAEADFRSRFGRGLLEVYAKEAEPLIRNGLLEWTGERLRLTRRGRLLGNRVFMQFVS
jgi:oxygen-independent coproporphyrinogen-3 oxidase